MSEIPQTPAVTSKGFGPKKFKGTVDTQFINGIGDYIKIGSDGNYIVTRQDEYDQLEYHANNGTIEVA